MDGVSMTVQDMQRAVTSCVVSLLRAWCSLGALCLSGVTAHFEAHWEEACCSYPSTGSNTLGYSAEVHGMLMVLNPHAHTGEGMGGAAVLPHSINVGSSQGAAALANASRFRHVTVVVVTAMADKADFSGRKSPERRRALHATAPGSSEPPSPPLLA
eukprot:5592025-Pleurochrysis_carterae.AAC.1